MYCKNCGATVADGSKFCPSCGAKCEESSGTGQKTEAGNGTRTIRLKCKSCQANMEVDASRQEATCPYCGEKMMIFDSDAVAAEKIKTNAYKEVEFAKMENEKATREAAESKEEKENYKKGKLAKCSIIFVFLCILMTIYSFSHGQILAGFIAIIQTGLFTVSWLMGMKIIKEPRKSISTAIAILGFILVIPFIMCSSGSGSSSSSEKLEWPGTGLAATLPKPESDRGNVIANNKNYFSADIDKTSLEDYENYLAKCQEAGYTIEAEPNGDSYIAFDANGNKLKLYYYDYNDSMNIMVDAPEEMSSLVWPTSGLASRVPAPDSKTGSISSDSSDSFTVYVGEMSKEDFRKYAEACRTAGFDVDYSSGDTYFSGKDAEGYELRLDYEGNNVVYIRISAPEEAEETTTQAVEIKKETEAETSATTPETTASTSGTEISTGAGTDMKEFLDSYEAFVDEYVEFMKKYQSSSDKMAMIEEYYKMFDKYCELMSTATDYAATDMSADDYAYYMEVMTRINKKIADIGS